MTIRREPSPLAGLLQELFQRKNWQRQLNQHQIFLAWPEIVGAELAAHARPHSVRGEVLWLEVSDSVWMHQLHLEKIRLLDLVNERIEGKGLQDIRFKLGTSAGAAPPVHEGGRAPGPVEISPADLNLFAEMMKPLQDEELKAILRRLWLKTRSR